MTRITDSYVRPQIKTLDSSSIVEQLGPVSAGSAKALTGTPVTGFDQNRP